MRDFRKGHHENILAVDPAAGLRDGLSSLRAVLYNKAENLSGVAEGLLSLVMQ